jgi:basic membrane protein A and related proteins
LTSTAIALALFGPQGKGSFNESGHQGAIAARAAGHAVDVHWISAQDPQERAQALHQICTDGCDLLIAHGGQGDIPVATVSPAFTDTRFAITQGHFVSPNTACYEVLQEHSAFLAGILAGLASRTGTVAHLSGERVRPGLKGRAAFADGVVAAGTGCRLLTTFIGHQHDPQLAYSSSLALHHAGADIIFAMIDGGRDGVSQACREWPMHQIGNVLDWVARDPDVFLASAVADSGQCVREAIEDHVHQRLRTGTIRTFGLERSDYVRLVCGADVSQEHRLELTRWQQRLIEGSYQPATDYNGPEFG